jgi:hypothetical protein
MFNSALGMFLKGDGERHAVHLRGQAVERRVHDLEQQRREAGAAIDDLRHLVG